ncbi:MULTISPECIES: hypothetical protein [Alphaproteobacteria]|uniref:Uncharacterized protein n=2 Tax=Alphaproteobacteria TaxID=28211 RepID=A0A512HE02_9HYPH|nr:MULTISPECIES: hypothetical protein [Alphaproteobacteria]GEO83679.1 hypothetical protein RNA01_06110 [Ciceribacter naphthalenivorans]GLR24169.1 hypothetical protein GCM10007920_39630 [Ciceribacter naphthalenivorans]GLT07025.1 hypothetical protein GCM10007926_39630 [Sphingomonas psychrolutea]
MEKTVLEDIQERLAAVRRELEEELDRRIAAQRERFRYQLERGKVRFEKDMRKWQAEYRTGLWRYVTRGNLAYLLTAPFIYGLIIPIVLLDLSVTIYQQICFRVYDIERVKRGSHIVIDREHLAYLNGLEKLNCIYCGYANGVIAYAREIAGRTERFWCPIKHATRAADPHPYFEQFLEYGDAEAYHAWVESYRRNKTLPEDPKP